MIAILPSDALSKSLKSNWSFCIATSIFRGHTVRAVCETFHLSKDAGFKVVAHMMPDLPNVGMERDVEQFIVSVPINLNIGFQVLQCRHT